ncbi:MAG TPA: DUF6600 domain-containing protein [Pyrinomonadaceae bacterium]|jgi:hypothetical protein
MRSHKTLFATTLFMLLLLLSFPKLARADDDEVEADEYDVTARVVRVSLLNGEVILRRASSKEWERATLNLPLVEGDTLQTGRGARLEIQIDARNYVRVQADSMLRIVTLREDGIALSLVQGTATLRLARFDRAKEYFEIDAPKTTLAAEKPGLYRLDAGREGEVRLTVREGGQARIYSETSGFTLRDGRSAELVARGTEEGDWQLSSASASDDWDTWVQERERYLAERLRYDARERYYDSDIWGAEELDAYGDWINAGDYGWVWRPSATVINNYYNWAPYRHGQWRWCPPYGWTWIGDEPWGWAPYHYGRWVYYNGRWCWAPRSQGTTARRNWWRPALVTIVYVATSSDEQVAWYPLSYGEHDPYRRNRRHRRRDDRHPPRTRDRDNPRHGNPHWRGGVTSLPARNFGRDTARPQPASAEIARRAETGEPVTPRLPISRPDADGVATRDRPLRPRAGTERPTREVPSATIPERETGAGNREPGVPLDEELQRRRLFNGRNPLPRVPASPSETTANPADRSTGAVERPAQRETRPRLDRGGDGNERDRRYPNNGPTPGRPLRPERPIEPSPGSTVETVVPEQRDGAPASPPQTVEPSPSAETPAPPAERPERRERPEGIERPARPERPAREDREEPSAQPERRSERQEAPAQRDESPAERPEAPVQRQEPQTTQTEPARVEPSTPEPRPEPPASQPAPPVSQPEPPAPREEAPPPAREEPPQQVETPAPQPSSPPPPPETPSPPAEAPRERDVAPERPAENDRGKTPTN